MTKTPEYRAWGHIKERCYNPNCKEYKWYGAQGIVMCDEWRKSFHKFLEDMGKKPGEKYSIDRINCNGNYEKSNCRWTTASVQAANRRKTRNSTLPRGVYLTKHGRFHARINIEKQYYNLGMFDSVLGAYAAYRKVFIEWYGQEPISWRL